MARPETHAYLWIWGRGREITLHPNAETDDEGGIIFQRRKKINAILRR